MRWVAKISFMYRWQMTREFASFQDNAGQLGDGAGGAVVANISCMFGWDLRPFQDNSSQFG